MPGLRSLLVGGAAALLTAAMPFAAAAGESAAASEAQVVTVRELPGDPRECADVARRFPEKAAEARRCVVTMVVARLGHSSDLRLVPRAEAATYTQLWRLEFYSLAWRVKMSYEVEYDWGRWIRLNWRRCSVPYSIGYSISFGWCSAWPDWFEPDWIDVGMDWTVSFLYNGFPIRADYWARRQHNYKGGFGFERYGRG
jgi:hypothetical protein